MLTVAQLLNPVRYDIITQRVIVSHKNSHDTKKYTTKHQ